jgi:hypothetical protein
MSCKKASAMSHDYWRQTTFTLEVFIEPKKKKKSQESVQAISSPNDGLVDAIFMDTELAVTRTEIGLTKDCGVGEAVKELTGLH